MSEPIYREFKCSACERSWTITLTVNVSATVLRMLVLEGHANAWPTLDHVCHTQDHWLVLLNSGSQPIYLSEILR